MALSCGTKLIKYLLFIFNTVVFILGAIITGFGIYFVVEANKELNGQGIGIPVFVLVLGLVVFLLGFLGCCGAWKENACMLKTFAAIIIVLVILQIIACILVFVYRGKFVTLAADAIATQINELNQLPAEEQSKVREAFDHMQKELECCGGHGPNDWGTKYPSSCCEKESKTCKSPYQQGCAKAMYELIKDKSLAVGVIIAVMAIVQLGAIIAACCLAKKIGEYEKV